MPSTPSFQQHLTDSSSSSYNRLSNNGSPSSYLSKDQLVPAYAQSHLSKVLSPLNSEIVRYNTVGGSDGAQGDARVVSEEVRRQASTSRLQVDTARNGQKDGEVDEKGKLSFAVQSIEDLFTTCFKTSRTRAWEKSRRIDESDWMLSKDELNEQLRPEEDGLVPLNAIAGRVVLYGWQLFANQVEINASLSPLKRRKRIYDDAHEARKQLIKLWVLVQWSKVASEIQVARSLIAFINDHFVQTDASITSLAETRDVLTNARLRRYDLVTAIELLGTGAPQRIPPLIKDAIHSYKAYTDAEAIGIVKELDDAIRLRLACEEVLPLPMMSYTIVDGRAIFRVASLFEADLTLSGASSEDRWWLLRVKFDFKVTGMGAERFPRQPKNNQRTSLLAMADAELAPRSIAAIPEQIAATDREMEGMDKEEFDEGTGEDVGMRDAGLSSMLANNSAPATRKDAPLVRLYNLLQSQALHYQLDIVHYQALQQIKLSWGRRLHVRMDMNKMPRTLFLAYWQKLDSDGAPTDEGWKPTASASLTISVQETDYQNGSENILKRLSTLSSEAEEDSEHGRGQIPERLELVVTWNIQGPAVEHLESTSVNIDSQNLNAEDLLLDVTWRHSEAAIKAIKSRITSSSIGRLMHMEDRCRFDSKGFKEQFLQLTLRDKVKIALHIDQMSGRIRLEEAGGGGDDDDNVNAISNATLAGNDWLQRLKQSSNRLNERPDHIVDILQGLRCKVILEDLEEKSTLLGINVTTRMPLRQVDYHKLQAKPGTLLYIALVQCPSYYLVIHVGEEDIRIALMCAGTFLENLITSMRIVSLEWLDWRRVVALSSSPTSAKRKRGIVDTFSTSSPFSVSKENLSNLHRYSVALICYHKVEEQLRARSLSYVHVGGCTNLRPPPPLLHGEDDAAEEADPVKDIVPSLSLSANSLLGPTIGAKINRNISIRLLKWWDPSKAHVAFSIRLRLKKGLVTKRDILETSQEKIQYDSETGILTFYIQNVDNALFIFVSSWRHTEKVIDLAQEIMSKGESSGLALLEFDLKKVRFRYADNLIAEVRSDQDLTKYGGGRYGLTLEKEGDGVNPSMVMKPKMVEWLNREDDASPGFWRRFLEILQEMLPILEHVYTFPEKYCESVQCPELQIPLATRIRLVFLETYVLDVELIDGKKVVFSDGATRLGDRARVSNDTATKRVQDEFSLDETVVTSVIKARTTSWTLHTIPTLETILSKLASEYREAKNVEDGQRTSTANILTFSNGLLCPNDRRTIDWFMPRIIDAVKFVLD
ncbi:hypothetical protein CBS101457_003948 [Exobasidium rhododendri]|nr:hypothetical protein CBS101457_003948 [Exobasidium rhododendri]